MLKRPGLVDRVHVEGLSGHSNKGSVPLWHQDVSLPDEGKLRVGLCVSSGLKEPLPDVEAVFDELTLCRSSSSSVFCLLTRSSSLSQKKERINK